MDKDVIPSYGKRGRSDAQSGGSANYMGAGPNGTVGSKIYTATGLGDPRLCAGGGG